MTLTVGDASVATAVPFTLLLVAVMVQGPPELGAVKSTYGPLDALRVPQVVTQVVAMLPGRVQSGALVPLQTFAYSRFIAPGSRSSGE